MARIERPHWSFSSINQYIRCPLQFYFERIAKIPRTSVPSALVFGSAMHDVLEHYHLGLKHGDDVPWNLLQLYFLESWAMKEADLPVDFKADETRDQLTEQAIELLRIYVQEPPPKDILWVEQEFLVPLHNSAGDYLETPLLTVLDLVSMDDGRMKISEFKTSGRAYGEFEVDTSLQATCYVNALWENVAKLPSVEFTVLVKTKTPKIQRVKTHRNEEDFGRLGDIIETVDRCVQQSIFYPIETPMNCSGCCYRTQCREWKPTKPSVGQLPIVTDNEVCTCSQN